MGISRYASIQVQRSSTTTSWTLTPSTPFQLGEIWSIFRMYFLGEIARDILLKNTGMWTFHFFHAAPWLPFGEHWICEGITIFYGANASSLAFWILATYIYRLFLGENSELNESWTKKICKVSSEEDSGSFLLCHTKVLAGHELHKPCKAVFNKFQ